MCTDVFANQSAPEKKRSVADCRAVLNHSDLMFHCPSDFRFKRCWQVFAMVQLLFKGFARVYFL